MRKLWLQSEYLYHKLASFDLNNRSKQPLNTEEYNQQSFRLEKPTYSHYANAGIYIFRNAVLRTLRAGERTDATDLIERCISGGGRVAYYPIRGTWIDVGSPADFRQASELMRHHRNLSAR